VPLDVMTVTIVPMLLGLAVDDTIHLVNHYILNFQAVGRYDPAGAAAMRSVGRAVALTSFVLILAFSPYLAAKMSVFRNMGALIGAGVLAALAADLVATPAIMKLAKAFGPERLG
jgi:predicted RND superfamily exporter protein